MQTSLEDLGSIFKEKQTQETALFWNLKLMGILYNQNNHFIHNSIFIRYNM